MGAKRVGTMWVNWIENKEMAPIATAMPSNNNGDLFVTIDNQATKKITIAFKVPSILANINEGVSLGGDGNMVRVAVKLMQQRSVKKQRILTDAYSKVLKAFAQPYVQDITIVPYNPYPELEVIDDSIWSTLSVDEKRLWISKNTDIELIKVNPSTQPVPAPPPNAAFENKVITNFPESIRQKVKKALEFQDKTGLRCGGAGGRQLAESIVNNENLGLKQLKRIYSYLKKNESLSNSLLSEGCAAIEYNAWGGKDMFDFLEVKIKDVEAWLN